MKPIGYIIKVIIVLFCGMNSNLLHGQDIPIFPEGKDGLLALGKYLVEASEEERRALTTSLRPLPEEYELVFKGKFAKRVRKYHRKYWRRHDPVMRPYHKAQTEPHCYVTTPDSLALYKGSAREFPGGYREIADKFQPGLILYRLRIIKPGMRLGTGFDVFVYINGNWRIFPRPWVLNDALLKD